MNVKHLNKYALCALAMLAIPACEHDNLSVPMASSELSELEVRAAEDMPLSRSLVAMNRVEVLRFETEAVKGNPTIVSYKLLHTGLAQHKDVGSTEVWEGDGFGVGRMTDMISQDGGISINNLNFTVKQMTSTSWSVFVTIIGGISGTHEFDIVDVQLADGGTVTGLPVHGNTFTMQSPVGPCVGTHLYVPEQCPTIQAALDVAASAKPGAPNFPAEQTIILVNGGTYEKGAIVRQNSNVLMMADGSGEVKVNNDNGPAIALEMNAIARLSHITLSGPQRGPGMGVATVAADFGLILEMDDVKVFTSSSSAFVNYTADVAITNSEFTGDGSPGSMGVAWYHANEGGRIFYNTFRNFQFGVYQCSGNAPRLSPTSLSDSNNYENVATKYYHDPNCN